MVAHHLLSLNELFVVGLALDLTGGVLLAKGLLVSGHAIRMRTSTFVGLNPYLALSVAEDRVEAATGLGVLGCGFMTQLVGYLLALALEPNRLARSIASAIAALALVVLAVGIVLAARALIRPVALRRTLVQLARSERTPSGQYEVRDPPDLALLLSLGRIWDGDLRPGETDTEYVERVFKVTAARRTTS